MDDGRWIRTSRDQESRWRPVSRILSVRPDVRNGEAVISLLRPTRHGVRERTGAGHSGRGLLGLAPGGVYRAALIAECAVVSYTTFSPFLLRLREGDVCFL